MTVAVFGPMAVGASREVVNRAAVDIIYKPLVGMPGPEEKERASIIRQIVEAAVMTHLHPRLLIRIVVQESQAQGSMLAVAINGVCIALLDAGIQIRYTFAAAEVGLRVDKQLVVDPDSADEEICGARALHVFRALPAKPAKPADAEEVEDILCSVTSGRFDEEGYWASLACGRSAADKVLAFMRKHVGHHYERLAAGAAGNFA